MIHFAVERRCRCVPAGTLQLILPIKMPLLLFLVQVIEPAWTATAADLPPTPVVVAAAEQVELAASQSFVGTVFPARTSDVGSAVDGRLVSFPIVDGQHVAAGEPIAELLRGMLEIERSGAAAELERRRQVLAELRAGTRSEDIAQARAVVAGFDAKLDYAKSRLARLTRLVERGTSTADELHDAQTEQRQIEAQLAGARAALALAEAGPRLELPGSTCGWRSMLLRIKPGSAELRKSCRRPTC